MGIRHRFMRCVHKNYGPKKCWVWIDKRNAQGYGIFEGQPAHRLAIELATGAAVPHDKFACHHCDNPPCVRPDHLYVGTAKTNARDSVVRGRAKSKLSLRVVEKIRAANKRGKTFEELAEQHGVCVLTIDNAVHGRTWSDVALKCGSNYCSRCV